MSIILDDHVVIVYCCLHWSKDDVCPVSILKYSYNIIIISDYIRYFFQVVSLFMWWPGCFLYISLPLSSLHYKQLWHSCAFSVVLLTNYNSCHTTSHLSFRNKFDLGLWQISNLRLSSFKSGRIAQPKSSLNNLNKPAVRWVVEIL